MARTNSKSKSHTLNLRVDPRLKAEFTAAAQKEKRPVAEVLREFMADFVERRKREQFRTEARRQSLLVAGSPDEAEVTDWIRDVTGDAE
jgi:Protein  of unknown function (DUF3018)